MSEGSGKVAAEIRLLVTEKEIKEAFEWVPTWIESSSSQDDIDS